MPVSGILDRLVSAAVAEFEFVGGRAHGQAEELVAEADAEDRLFADEIFEGGLDVVDGLRVAGAVGDEDAVGLVGEDFVGGGVGRDDGDAASGLGEVAEDIAFEAAVDGDDIAGRFAMMVGELGPVRLYFRPRCRALRERRF